MRLWAETLRPGGLFVDVGANVGLYTIWALDCGAEVIACEPAASAVVRLRENVRVNGYRASILAAALADKPGSVKIAGTNTVRQHLVLDGSDGELVPVATLDDVLGARFAAGVKIDVEGAERLVLEGAAKALREQRIALLQLEWNPLSDDLLHEDRQPVARLLTDAGYELVRPDESLRLVTVADVGYGQDLFARPARLDHRS